jgi:TRAP-type C4-dicarboxylate transport system permease small subunit
MAAFSRLRTLHLTVAQGIVLVTYSAVAVLTVLQVFARYVLGDPLPWTEEAARYAFIWLIFTGMVISLHRGTHASVDILLMLCKGVGKKRVRVGIHCISIALFSVLCWHGYLLFDMVQGQLSPAMRISMMIPYAALPFGCALMVIEEMFLLTGILRGDTEDTGGQK